MDKRFHLHLLGHLEDEYKRWSYFLNWVEGEMKDDPKSKVLKIKHRDVQSHLYHISREITEQREFCRSKGWLD